MIYDKFTLYSFGGAGGSGADATYDNGSGGGGYPRSWDRWWSELGPLVELVALVGADTLVEAGDNYIGTQNHTSANNSRGGKGGKNGQSGERIYDSYAPLHSGGGYNYENTKDFAPYVYSQGLDILSNGQGGRWTSRR